MVIDVLKPFEAATQEMCTQDYSPASKVIPLATLLQQVTAANGNVTNPGVPPTPLTGTNCRHQWLVLLGSFRVVVGCLIVGNKSYFITSEHLSEPLIVAIWINLSF